jgi:CubicO group peptidase (beta-lactamase class C family)
VVGRIARLGWVLFGLTACAEAGWTPPPGAPIAPPGPSHERLRVADEPLAPPAFADPERRTKLLSAAPAIDARFVEALAGEDGALSLGLVIDSELALARGYGRRAEAGGAVDERTVYRIGSITKTFTGMAALILRDEGKIDLDAPAARYLRELDGLVYPVTDAAPITLRQLLTHTSGLPRLGSFDYTAPNQPVELADMLSSLADFALREPPAMSSRYSNLGVSLAGLAIERVAGMRYRDFVTRRILEPLGMRFTLWHARRVPVDLLATGRDGEGKAIDRKRHWLLGASEASGGLYSSVADMARYAAYQLAAWPPRSDPEGGPLSRSSLRESHRMVAFGGMRLRRDEGDEAVRATARGVGIGWMVEQSCRYDQLVHHNGGTEGYRAALYLLPLRGVAAIVLTSAKIDPDALARRTLELLDETGALEPRRPRLPAALDRALARVEALLSAPDAALDERTYAELFSPSFRDSVPREQLVKELNEDAADYGACRRAHVTGVTSSGASARMSCEHGALEVRVRLDDDDPSRLSLFGWDDAPSQERCPRDPPARREPLR